MKMFEISSKQNKNGRRKFKAVLYKIFPDSCVDDLNQVGTQYNANGITWIKEFCEAALPSISGMSLRCEFTDEDRTQLLGHGDTDIIDGEPIFEDAVVIGTFQRGYIDEIDTDNGRITVCIGEGEIDSSCYHNFVTKLDEDIAKGIYPNGSVEITRTADNQEIKYKYGYKEFGRIPVEFVHSGYALLGITPADDNAKLIELNMQKEDVKHMEDMKTLARQVAEEVLDCTAEINRAKEECAMKVAEANAQVETAVTEKNSIEASSQEIQAALDKVREEYAELDKKYNDLWEEHKALEKALGEAKARERIGEMKTAIASFTEDERAYAQDAIDAFMEDPASYEINTIVNKIWEGIGKATRATNDRIVSEQNTAAKVDDIFAEVEYTAHAEDTNIF